MIREVELTEYLPPFMKEYKEPVKALEAENPEFEIIWNATDRVLYNHFITTADEYGISRFESLLGIYPLPDDTLESRRSRVASKWFNKIPYTLKKLLQKLMVLCGDTDFTVTHDFETGYTLNIDINLELYGQVEELEYLVNTMVPLNIVTKAKNTIPCIARGEVFVAGGICHTDWVTVTNDFREVYDIEGSIKAAGGICHTDWVTVTNDLTGKE
jgi:hypothetical protein